MKLLKPHSEYGNIMSVYKTIFRFGKVKIMMQEYYSPHFIEMTVWVREEDTGMYVLKKWYNIALDKYARAVKRFNKLNSQTLKVKAYIDKLAEKGVHSE